MCSGCNDTGFTVDVDGFEFYCGCYVGRSKWRVWTLCRVLRKFKIKVPEKLL